MENRIIEITFLPKGILVIYYVQLIVVSSILVKTEGVDSLFYIINPLTLSLGFFRLKKEFTPTLFSYKFLPIQFKKKKIKWKEVKQIKIIKVNALEELLGWGVRYSPKYGWSYILEDGYVMFLITDKNKKRTFSIKNKEKVLAFLEINNIQFEIDSL